MNKADVMTKLEEYKGRPIEIGLSDEGAMLFAGIEGHWLFVQGDNLVEIRKNISDGNHGFNTINQQQSPFCVMVVPFEVVNYVRSFITNDPGDVKTMTTGLEPVGTDKSLDEIIKELESDPVRKASSPRGYTNNTNAGFDSPYGKFRGSMLSTDIDGIPKYIRDELTKNS